MKKLFYLILLIITLTGCSSETCKIDFEKNANLYNEALKEIHSLNFEMNSQEPYYRIVKSFNKTTSPFESKIFEQIEFIELHEDGTIIFQAPNCVKESDFRDVVYFVAFAPLGESHIERKRDIGNLEELDGDWYLGTDISSIAD